MEIRRIRQTEAEAVTDLWDEASGGVLKEARPPQHHRHARARRVEPPRGLLRRRRPERLRARRARRGRPAAGPYGRIEELMRAATRARARAHPGRRRLALAARGVRHPQLSSSSASPRRAASSALGFEAETTQFGLYRESSTSNCDVEPVALGGVAGLAQLERVAVLVVDDALLDEQRGAEGDVEQLGVLRRRRPRRRGGARPMVGTWPPSTSVSWSERRSRSARWSSAARTAGKTASSIATGSSSASRRRRSDDDLHGRLELEPRGLGGARLADLAARARRELGSRPRRRISSVNERRCRPGGGRAARRRTCRGRARGRRGPPG